MTTTREGAAAHNVDGDTVTASACPHVPACPTAVHNVDSSLCQIALGSDWYARFRPLK
jgi:hypothetical protein